MVLADAFCQKALGEQLQSESVSRCLAPSSYKDVNFMLTAVPDGAISLNTEISKTTIRLGVTRIQGGSFGASQVADRAYSLARLP